MNKLPTHDTYTEETARLIERSNDIRSQGGAIALNAAMEDRFDDRVGVSIDPKVAGRKFKEEVIPRQLPVEEPSIPMPDYIRDIMKTHKPTEPFSINNLPSPGPGSEERRQAQARTRSPGVI